MLFQQVIMVKIIPLLYLFESKRLYYSLHSHSTLVKPTVKRSTIVSWSLFNLSSSSVIKLFNFILENGSVCLFTSYVFTLHFISFNFSFSSVNETIDIPLSGHHHSFFLYYLFSNLSILSRRMEAFTSFTHPRHVRVTFSVLPSSLNLNRQLCIEVNGSLSRYLGSWKRLYYSSH